MLILSPASSLSFCSRFGIAALLSFCDRFDIQSAMLCNCFLLYNRCEAISVASPFFPIALQSLFDHSLIASLLPSYRFAIALQSLRYCFAIASLSLCDHLSIDSLSLYNRFAIAL
jgi:hypothetical protein